jgi:hypothetical protein
VTAVDRWEDDRWPALPLHRRIYQLWWGRPWPVWRDTDRDPDIPKTPDIGDYEERRRA